MAARTLPHVLRRDAHPSVARRIRDHRLDQAAIGLLDLPAPTELGLGVPQPDGERIAHPLQLRDAEHSGATQSRHGPFDSLAGERRGEELAKPLLEGSDLEAQIVTDTPLRELVRPWVEEQGIEGLGRRRRGARRLDLQKFVGHDGSLRKRRPAYSNRDP